MGTLTYEPYSQFYFLTRVLISFSRERYSCCAISVMFSDIFILFFLHPRSFFHYSFSCRALQKEKVLFRLSCGGLIHECFVSYDFYLFTSNTGKQILGILYNLPGSSLFEQHPHHTPDWNSPPTNNNECYIYSNLCGLKLLILFVMQGFLYAFCFKENFGAACEMWKKHHVPKYLASWQKL